MKTTRHYHFTGNDPVTIETDQSANMCQITAFGDAGTLSLTAQTDLIGPFEPVLAKEGDTDPISLDLTAPATCRFGPYRIRTLQFTPAGTSGKYTIILSQWEE